MANGYVVSRGNATTANNASVTPTLPTHATGDLLVLVWGARGNGAPGTPSGWTAVSGGPWSNGTSNTNQIHVFYKIAASSSETNPTVTYSGGAAGQDTQAFAFVLRGPTSVSALGSQFNGTSAQNIGNITGGAVSAYQAVMFVGEKADDSTVSGAARLQANSLFWAIAGYSSTTTGNDATLLAQLALPRAGVTISSSTLVISGGASATSVGISLVFDAVDDWPCAWNPMATDYLRGYGPCNVSGSDFLTVQCTNFGRIAAGKGIPDGAKGYFEITVTSVTSGGVVGVVGEIHDFDNGAGYPGGLQYSMGWGTNGEIREWSTLATTVNTWTTGDVLGIAVDRTQSNDTFWFRVNGGNWNNSGSADPATNTGGITGYGNLTGRAALYPSVKTEASVSTFTLNAGKSAWAYTPPSGFSGLDTGANNYSQSLSASNQPVSALVRRAGKPLLATNTPTKSLVRAVAKALSATTTPTKQILRSTTKTLLAANTPVAALASARVLLKSVLAATQPVASLARQAGKLLLSTDAAAASLGRASTKTLSTTTTPAKSISRATTKRLGATSTPVASLAKLKAIAVALLAATTPSALLTRRTTKPMPTTTAAAANVSRSTTKRLLTATTPARALSTLRVRLKILQASTTPVASLGRGIGKLLRAATSAVARLALDIERTLPSAPPPWRPPGYFIPPFGFPGVGVVFLPVWTDPDPALGEWTPANRPSASWTAPRRAETKWSK
jgi:hypothetical protein